MIERNLIDSNITKNIYTNYFAHYKTESKNIVKYGDPFEKNFRKNYEELSKDNWELHKQYIKEGVNRKEIAQIIRNDEIEKLQEISSETNFDFNQIIEPSLYEICSFVNQRNVTLIDYAAFFGSIKCFKYLLMNGANVENTGKYAVAGGNEEIIHLCEQNHSSFEDTLETAIMFHKNNIFKYIYENKIKENQDQYSSSYDSYSDDFYDDYKESENSFFENLGVKCILYNNYEILIFLQKEGMHINNAIINKTVEIGNIYLFKHFLKDIQIPNDILSFSSVLGNIELFKFILGQKGINVNAGDISLFYLILILKI